MSNSLEQLKKKGVKKTKKDHNLVIDIEEKRNGEKVRNKRERRKGDTHKRKRKKREEKRKKRRETKERLERRKRLRVFFWVWGKRREESRPWGFCDCCCCNKI